MAIKKALKNKIGICLSLVIGGLLIDLFFDGLSNKSFALLVFTVGVVHGFYLNRYKSRADNDGYQTKIK